MCSGYKLKSLLSQGALWNTHPNLNTVSSKHWHQKDTKHVFFRSWLMFPCHTGQQCRHLHSVCLGNTDISCFSTKPCPVQYICMCFMGSIWQNRSIAGQYTHGAKMQVLKEPLGTVRTTVAGLQCRSASTVLYSWSEMCCNVNIWHSSL